jgi:hypothetical protein
MFSKCFFILKLIQCFEKLKRLGGLILALYH